MNRRADHHIGVGGRHLLGSCGPPLDVTVREALLHRIELGVIESRPEVTGVEEHQLDAGAARRLADGVVHPVGMVEVVELVHGGDAREHELGE